MAKPIDPCRAPYFDPFSPPPADSALRKPLAQPAPAGTQTVGFPHRAPPAGAAAGDIRELALWAADADHARWLRRFRAETAARLLAADPLALNPEREEFSVQRADRLIKALGL